MIGRKHKAILTYFLSISLFLILWTILAKSINAPLILPSVKEVFIKIWEIIKTKYFWVNFSYTFFRVLSAFIISLFFGTIIGIFSGSSQFVKDFIDFPITFIRTTPVVAIIMVALFWFKSSKIPVFVAVLMGLPIVVTSIDEGYRKNEENLDFMATVYNFSQIQKFKYIKIPAIKPFFINSAVSVFGISWKVVVAGEVLSIPKFGFGSFMQEAQVHLETSTVISITILLASLSFIIEKLFREFIKKLGIKKGN